MVIRKVFFKKGNILPLPSLIEFFKLQFMHKYVQGLLPASFCNLWINNATRHQDLAMQLRNHQELYTPPARLATTEAHPYHSFPKAWSLFENHDVKIQRESHIFNAKLKNHFVAMLNENYTCNRLLCPHCHLNTE